MNIYLKNSDGKPSVSLTMVVISFTVVMLWLVGWLVGTTLGYPVPEFDAASAMAFLVPILGLYFSRKFMTSHDMTSKTVSVNMEDTGEGS